MRTAVLVLCAFMAAAGYAPYVLRHNKDADARSDSKKALKSALHDLTHQQLVKHGFHAAIKIDRLTKLLKQTQKQRDAAIANRQTTRQRLQGKQNRKRWADGTVCNWGDQACTPIFTVSDDEEVQDILTMFLEIRDL